MPASRTQRCTCGCNEELSRRQIIRHLNGESVPKRSLIERARNKCAKTLFPGKQKRKHRDATSAEDAPTASPRPPSSDDMQSVHHTSTQPDVEAMADPEVADPPEVPFPGTAPPDVGLVSTAPLPDGAADMGERAGVWRTRVRCETIGSTSSRDSEHSTDAGSDSADTFGFWGEESDEDEGGFELGEDDIAPWLRGLSKTDILREEFEVDWTEHGHRMSADDMENIRAFNYKVEADLSAQNYTKLRRAFPSLKDLLTHNRLQTRMAFLSGLSPSRFDCCVNSCCCFTGPYATLEKCPFCHTNRYSGSSRNPRNTFDYLPLAPRLSNMFLNDDLAERMQYRHNYETRAGRTADVFDSKLYKDLRRHHVTIGGDELPHKFFQYGTDIALGISTDGFAPFKRRKQT
ncbi:hypothetical protein EV715DRAFT_214129, partial [Schizophyllum commune]